MDNKAIETLAISAVRDSIVTCDYLDQFIPDNDKEPSWDGAIYIYNNKNKKKENLKGRIPVQVKGTIRSNFSKEEISYRVSVTDLKNYLHDGGAIFFVVYIDENGAKKKIYYACLPPIKLRIYLKKKNVKTIPITFLEFPSDNNAKASILLTCLENCRMQASYVSAKLFTLDELKKQGVLKKLCIPVSGIKGQSPEDLFFSNELYLYAEVEGNSIPQPLEILLKEIERVEKIKIPISVNGKKFYDSFKGIRTTEGHKIKIGESFYITANEDNTYTYNYENSDSIRTLAKDLEFMLTIIENDSITLGDITLPINFHEHELTEFDVAKNKMILEYCQQIIEALTILNCDKDFFVSKMTQQDWKHMNILVDSFVKKEIIHGLSDDVNKVVGLEIQGAKFAVVFAKSPKEKGAYTALDFFNTKFQVTYKNEKGEYKPASQYCILKANDFATLANVRYDAILESYKALHGDPVIYDYANMTLLEMLLAYDQTDSKNSLLLQGAKELALWLLEEASDEAIMHSIRVLNYLQIVRREREYTLDEIGQLAEITETSSGKEMILVGAYLLLGNYDFAKLHFNRLSDEDKAAFKNYPIYSYWRE